MVSTFSDGYVFLSICGRVMVGLWRAPFSHVRLTKLRELAVTMRVKERGALGMIAVFESDAIQLSVLSNEALRRDAARLQSEFAESFTGGQSIVLEGSGFAVAALRATAIAVQAVSRLGAHHVFHPNANAGIRFLAERMQLSAEEQRQIEVKLAAMRAEAR